MEKEELYETDVVVRSAHPGTPGDWGFGPATPYNFYIEGDDRKFGWFHSEKKPIVPDKGMRIKMMVYYVEEGDEYTNYKVTKIVLHDAQKKAETPHKPVPVAQTDNKQKRDNSITMYISYAKDIAVAQIAQGGFEGITTREIAKVITDIGKEMQDDVNEIDIWSDPPTEKEFKEVLDAEQEAIRDGDHPASLTEHHDGPPEDQFPPFSE